MCQLAGNHGNKNCGLSVRSRYCWSPAHVPWVCSLQFAPAQIPSACVCISLPRRLWRLAGLPCPHPADLRCQGLNTSTLGSSLKQWLNGAAMFLNALLAYPAGKVWVLHRFSKFPRGVKIWLPVAVAALIVLPALAPSPSLCSFPTSLLIFPAPAKQTTCTQVLPLSQDLLLGGPKLRLTTRNRLISLCK